MSRRTERSESVDNICPVCHDIIDIFAIGPCDHPVCSRCSTRMRVLCEQLDCPICRSQMPQVAFVYKKSYFQDISLRDCIPNRKYKIFFEDKDVEDSFEDLLEFRCPMTSCQNRNPDRSFALLQTHMRRDHQLFACDLCILHLKIFPFERKFYNRKNLATHRRVGDEDDKSYKGHPLCEFCDVRYNDKDELLKHLRKDHYFCHYCDQQGSNAYYDQYADLMKHFADGHFLCTEGDCGNPSTQFTHAFVSEIDLKAHRASAHNKNLSKAQSREARTIDVDFQLPRRRPGHRDDYDESRSSQGGRGERYNRRRDYDADDAEFQRAIEASKDLSRTETPAVPRESVPDPVADFPALNGAIVPASMPAAQKTVAAPMEDFPTLSASRSSKQITQTQVKAYSSVMNRQTDVKPAAPIVKESKPVSLGSVAKVYRDQLSSAPRNTEDEYPTLGGGSTSAPPHTLTSKASSANWAMKSKHSNVLAISAAPSITSKSHTNGKSKSAQSESSLMKDENQFPKLAAGGLQNSKDRHLPDWIKQNGVSSKQKQKAENLYDESFELPDTYRQPFEGSTPVEKTINIVKPLADTVVVNKHSKPAAINNPEEFPGLPVRTSKAKTKDDNKRKKKIKKEETIKAHVSDDSNACLGEIALALMQPGRLSGPGSETKMNNNNRPSKILDWFDNPPAPPEAPQPRSSQVKVDVSPKITDTPPLSIEDSSNFPSLHSMSISIQQPKPPPGFSSYPPSPSLTTLSAPPGFEHQPPTLSSIPSTPPGFSLNATYIQPTDFRPRNLKLIEDIRQALITVEEGFPNFKVLSSHFRQGLTDASNYYLSCLALMGEKEFSRVFPELLALLPDIKKQRELWEVQKSQDKKLRTVSPNKLSDCQICGQLMVAEDVYSHQLQHASSTDFPLLSAISSTKIAGSSGLGSDMQMKESWIRAK